MEANIAFLFIFLSNYKKDLPSHSLLFIVSGFFFFFNLTTWWDPGNMETSSFFKI